MKKKLSAGLVLLIVLMTLAAATALAAALLWEQQVIPMKEIEQAKGDYMDIRAIIVDEYGKVIGDPDVNMPSVWELAANARAREETEASPIVQAYLKYVEQANGSPIQLWPIELKAAYSQEVRPMVQRALSTGEMAYDAEGAGPTKKTIIASTTYAYGLPDPADLSLTEAQGIAEQKLFDTYRLETKSIVSVYPYYDITVPESPRWKFVFYTNYDLEVMYRVELNARTGEIVATESFPKGGLLQDLTYDLKLY